MASQLRTTQRYRELGIPPSYHGHAAYYERLFQNAGWNDKQIDQALRFGATYQGGDEQAMIRDFKDLAARHDMPEVDLVVDAALGVRDTINDHGFEALPNPVKVETSFTSADAARLAEISQINRNEPDRFNADRDLQDEQLALIEARLASGGKVSASAANEPAKPSGAAGDRLAQIRQICRDDSHRYDNDKALQAEELSLIEASLPKSEPAPAPTGGGATVATQQPAAASEGSTANV